MVLLACFKNRSEIIKTNGEKMLKNLACQKDNFPDCLKMLDLEN